MIRFARRGFTLIEAALATVIVGVAFAATMELFGACTRQNQVSSHMTSALMLSGQVQEAMQGLTFNDPVNGTDVFGAEAGETLATYNDLDDFDGLSFSPPIDAMRQQLPLLSQYTQIVSVMPVYPKKPGSNANEASPDIPKTTYTGAVRVRVRVLYRARPSDVPEEVYRTSWIRLDQ